jgi:transcriptional regulator with XRE-family HTH domain
MVGTAIRRRRDELGISQGTLAERVGKDQPFISEIERRTTPGYLPAPELLNDIAKALQMPVATLLNAAGYLPDEDAPDVPQPDPLADPTTRVFTAAVRGTRARRARTSSAT